MIVKSLIPLSALFAGTLLLSPDPQEEAAAAPGADRSTKEFQIDGVHSSIMFRVKHLDVCYFYGRFNKMKGSFQVDDADLGKSFIKMEVPVDSVDTNSSNRDKHLKSQDFFNATEFPKISFESTRVEKSGDSYRVTGDLTLRGVKKSITFKARHTGTGKVSDRFGLRSGYEAVIDIKRSDFGVTYGVKGDLVGDDVRIMVAVEGMLPPR